MRVFPKEVADFFKDVVTKMIDYRKKNKVARNDFLQVLIEIKNEEGLQSGKIICCTLSFANLQIWIKKTIIKIKYKLLKF